MSCIYGLGNPEAYGKGVVTLQKGQVFRRNALLRQLIEIQYQRNDMVLSPGTFRVRGETMEIYPAYMDRTAYRLSFFGDELERIQVLNPVTGEFLEEPEQVQIFPAKHYITQEDRMKQAIADIEAELEEQLQRFKAEGKFLEAQRIEQRARYDIEMLKKWLLLRDRKLLPPPRSASVGSPPWTLMDTCQRIPAVPDESHMTVPQIRGMFNATGIGRTPCRVRLPTAFCARQPPVDLY